MDLWGHKWKVYNFPWKRLAHFTGAADGLINETFDLESPMHSAKCHD